MSKNNIIYQSPPEDIAWKLKENDQNLVVESIQKCFHDAAKPLNINMALYGTSIMINLALPTKVSNIFTVKNLNPHTPVAQKVSDEVVIRRFQGEGVEFFLNRS